MRPSPNYFGLLIVILTWCARYVCDCSSSLSTRHSFYNLVLVHVLSVYVKFYLRDQFLLTCLSRTCRRYVEVESPSMKKLYITKIVRNDTGNYTCSATIKGRQQRKTVALRIFSEFLRLNAVDAVVGSGFISVNPWTPTCPNITTSITEFCLIYFSYYSAIFNFRVEQNFLGGSRTSGTPFMTPLVVSLYDNDSNSYFVYSQNLCNSAVTSYRWNLANRRYRIV